MVNLPQAPWKVIPPWGPKLGPKLGVTHPFNYLYLYSLSTTTRFRDSDPATDESLKR